MQCLVRAGVVKASFEALNQCFCILWSGYCNCSGRGIVTTLILPFTTSSA